MRRNLLLIPLIIWAVFGLFSRDASAASCSFTAIAGVSFGGYDVFDPSHTDSAGSIAYRCTGVVPGDTVRIDLSRGNALAYTPRELLNGAAKLFYNLFLDAARTAIWGDGNNGSISYGPVVPPDGVEVTVPLYGRIPANQDAEVGIYTDSITVTMLF